MRPETWQEIESRLCQRWAGHSDIEKLALIDACKALAELDRVRMAARALLDDVRRRYPGEDLRCPFMRELDESVRSARAVTA